MRSLRYPLLIRLCTDCGYKNNAARFHASVNDYFNRIEVDTYEDDNKALLQNILQYAAKGTGYKADETK